MTIWGLCTILHIWVRAKWQLVLLRMIIGTMEGTVMTCALSLPEI